MRILLADDHALVRRGLIELLSGSEPAWRFDQAGSYPELYRGLEDGGYDLAIADLHMPGMEGAESLRILRGLAPATRLIVLTAEDDRATILACLGAGVHGYMPKSSDPTQILEGIRLVLMGGMYVPPILSQLPAPPPPAPPPAPAAEAAPGVGEGLKLSGRQQQVLNLLAEGRSTKDIARILDLGIGTVKVHLAAIYRNLGARNRMEAIVRAGVIKAHA